MTQGAPGASAALPCHYTGDASTAGTERRGEIDPLIAEVLAERGLHVGDHTPTRLTYEQVAADVVVPQG